MINSTRLAQYALRLLLLIGVLAGSSGSALATDVTFGTSQVSSYDVLLTGINTTATDDGGTKGSTSATDGTLTISFAANGSSYNVTTESAGDLKFQNGTSFTLTGNVKITKVVIDQNYDNKTYRDFTTTESFTSTASGNVQTLTNTDGIDANNGLTFTSAGASSSSTTNTYAISIAVTYESLSTTPYYAEGTVTKYVNDASFTNALSNTDGYTITYGYTDIEGTVVSAISDAGAVTLSGTVGSATITASYTGTSDSSVTGTTTYTLTVSLAPAGIAFDPSSETKTVETEAYTPTLTNTNGVTISSYTSSNTSVATVSSDGLVTITGPGETTIKAYSEASTTYAADSASYVLTVTTPYSITFDETSYTAIIGEDFTQPTYTFAYNGTAVTETTDYSFSYTMVGADASQMVWNYGDESNLAYDPLTGTTLSYDDGIQTIGSTSGTVWVTVKAFKGDVLLAYGYYTLHISKASPELAYTDTDVSLTIDGTNYAIGSSYSVNSTLSNTKNVDVTYISSNTSVATVDESTGDVTLAGAGTTTISACFAGNDSYAADTASYTLTVIVPTYTVSFGTSGVSTFFTGVDTKSYDGEQSLTADDITITFYSSSDGKNRINFVSGCDSLCMRSNTTFTITSPYEGVKITKVVVTQDDTSRSFSVYENDSSSSSTVSCSSKTNTYTSTSGVSSVTFSPNSGTASITKIEVTYTSSTVLAGINYTTGTSSESPGNKTYTMAFTSDTGTIRGGRVSAHFIGLGVSYGADGESWYTTSTNGSSPYVATTANAPTVTDGVPTAGYFLTLEAYTNGYVTLDCKGASTYTVYHASNKKVETVDNTSSSFVVHGGHTYYVYNTSSNLNVSSVTFEPAFIYESTADDGTVSYSRLTVSTLADTPEIGKEFDYPEIGSQEDAGYVSTTDASSSYVLVATNGEVSLVSGTSNTITVTCTIPTTDKISSTSNLSYSFNGITGNTKVYMVSGTPTVGQKAYVYASDSDTNPLITMTYGGWPYNSNTYIDIYDSNKELTDSWTAADKTDDAGEDDAGFRTRTIDGFYLDSNGKNDAKSEVYVNTTDNTHGHFVVGDKNSIPCRGSYYLFEPAQNGTLSVYVLQNGCINEYTSDTSTEVYWPVEKDALTGVVSWRPLYFVDETGTPQTASVATTKNPTTWTASTLKTAIDNISATKNSEDTDYGLYWDYTYDTNNQNLNDMPGPKQTIIKAAITDASSKDVVTPYPSGDGGYLLLEKSYAKYSFDVKVGKSYYLFSNFTKIGLSGFLFEPGETQPASDSNYELANRLDSYTAPNADAYYETATFTGRSNFVNGEWTTLCLPFSVSAAQMRKTFGSDVQMIEFNNVSENGEVLNLIHHVYDQTVAAGVPYLIKPGLATDDDGNTTESLLKDATTGYVYIDGGIYVPGGDNAVTPITVKSVDNGGLDGFEWRGQFANDATLTTGDHYFYGGNVCYYTDDKTHNSNSFRAFLKQITNGAKIYLRSTSFGEAIDDTTTGIMAIETMEAAEDAAATLNNATGVYNLSGQKVGNDSSVITSLPAGVYVVNGKKLVIR